MAVIGFKEYKEGDPYKARRAMGRMSNLIWRTIGAIVVIAAIALALQYFGPCQKQVFSTINDAPEYIH
jgi:hypothetical protein